MTYDPWTIPYGPGLWDVINDLLDLADLELIEGELDHAEGEIGAPAELNYVTHLKAVLGKIRGCIELTKRAEAEELKRAGV